jgi:hypothetical protein
LNSSIKKRASYEIKLFSSKSKRVHSNRVALCYDHNGCYEFSSCKKVDFITDTASTKALEIAVKELNIRESLVWSKIKISNNGYTPDEDIYAALDKNLGVKFKWKPGPAISGRTLHCESQSIVLTRIPSTNSAAGKWH